LEKLARAGKIRGKSGRKECEIAEINGSNGKNETGKSQGEITLQVYLAEEG